MATEQHAVGNCRRCGWKYPLRKLKYEVQPSGEQFRVCDTCLDPYNIRAEPGIYDAEEDTSVENLAMPILGNQRSLYAFAPVGAVTALRINVCYRFA